MGNNLLALCCVASSCDGEPAPDRVLLAILPAEFNGRPNGDLKGAPPIEASVGDVLEVEEPERGKPTAGWGKWPRLR